MSTPVVILCGGQGTRFREQTENRPKPMIEVAGRPILWHIMSFYAGHGFKDFVLCLGYKSEVIKRYFLDFAAMESDFTVDLSAPDKVQYHGASMREWKVTCVDTGLNAMTGARLKPSPCLLRCGVSVRVSRYPHPHFPSQFEHRCVENVRWR
jgi:glucose-1-phosphate cytidylyltransferase